MRLLKTILVAAGMTLAVASTAPEASAHGFHRHFGGHWGHHGGHHWGHRWGHHWGWGRHWRYHYHYRYGYRWHHRFGYRSWGYAVASGPRVCPAGTHLGYLGRFCHPNRF